MLTVLVIEPYCGGSHKAFVEGYRAHSRHRVQVLGMPARKWKWRMRGAVLRLADLLPEGRVDAILASDYLDLAALTGLRPRRMSRIAKAVYFHENQLTHPLPNEADRDYQYGFTNITTCLAAERVIFNSRYHLESFLAAVGRLLRRMPDCLPERVPERIRERALVIPVGVDLESIDRARPAAGPRRGRLSVLWNHRWEFDKGPERFFEVMERLDKDGCDFELAVVGQTFRSRPAVFERARKRLGHRLRAFGHVESREDYLRLLLESDVVVSTAAQEFFGISVVEAIYAGCLPLLPDGLSYREILPPHLHGTHLYRTPEELFNRLRRWAARPEEARVVDLRAEVRRFGWDCVAPRLDATLEEMCAGGNHD